MRCEVGLSQFAMHVNPCFCVLHSCQSEEGRKERERKRERETERDRDRERDRERNKEKKKRSNKKRSDKKKGNRPRCECSEGEIESTWHSEER